MGTVQLLLPPPPGGQRGEMLIGSRHKRFTRIVCSSCLLAAAAWSCLPARADTTPAAPEIEGLVYDLDAPIATDIAASLALPSGTNPESVVGDLNGDGRADLAILSAESQLTTVIFAEEGPAVRTIDLPELSGAALAASAVMRRGSCSDLVLVLRDKQIAILRSDCRGRFELLTLNVRAKRGAREIAVLDVDGDGLEELLVTEIMADRYTVLESDDNGRLAESSWQMDAGAFGASVLERLFGAGDLNGDGRGDLLAVLRDTTGFSQLFAAYSTEGKRFLATPAAFPISAYFWGARVSLADVDGDGLPELLHQHGSQIETAGSIPTEEQQWNSWGAFSYVELPRLEEVQPADLNGDGAADLVTKDPLSRGWRVLLSAGTDGIASEIPNPLATIPLWKLTWFADIDGDKRDEVLVLAPDASILTVLEARVSTAPAGLSITVSDRELQLQSGGTFRLQPTDQANELAVHAEQARVFPSRRTIGGAPSVPLVFSLTRLAHPPSGNNFTPGICIGYNPGSPSPWGGRLEAECARGSLAVEADDLPRSRLTCCYPLAEDLLTEDHRLADGRCPEGYAVTGARRGASLRCTKINTERYRLSEVVNGMTWGSGKSQVWRMRFTDETPLHRLQLPLSLRFAPGRESIKFWGVDGCIGPADSVLIGKVGKHCSETLFAQVVYAGRPGDPPAGTPVRLYAPCKLLSTVIEPYPRCLLP